MSAHGYSLEAGANGMNTNQAYADARLAPPQSSSPVPLWTTLALIIVEAVRFCCVQCVHPIWIYMIIYGGFLKSGYPQSSSLLCIWMEDDINHPFGVPMCWNQDIAVTCTKMQSIHMSEPLRNLSAQALCDLAQLWRFGVWFEKLAPWSVARCWSLSHIHWCLLRSDQYLVSLCGPLPVKPTPWLPLDVQVCRSLC